MPELDGLLAIVTRASSGLGEATAVRLAELGARVGLLARSEAGLDRVGAALACLACSQAAGLGAPEGRCAGPLLARSRSGPPGGTWWRYRLVT